MEVFEIETERLQLRQFRVEDAQDVFAIFSDEQTTLDCGGYHAFDAMDEEYDRLMQKFAGQTRYSVVRKADGRVIGVISLMDAERAVPGWELGIEMALDVRRQGYAREALAAVIQAFFEKTDTVLFTGGHYAYNTISGELLKKLGFTYEGIEHKAMRHAERGPTDLVRYSLENKFSLRIPTDFLVTLNAQGKENLYGKIDEKGAGRHPAENHCTGADGAGSHSLFL